MGITTYTDFVNNYLTKNGMIGNAANINKAPDQLKLEIDELNLTKASLDGLYSEDGSLKVPVDPIETTPQMGYFRYNSTLNIFEGYSNGMWQPVGGGQMLGQALVKAVSYNAQTISENIVVPAGLNAYSVGNVTVNAGGSITIEAGSVYKIL